ncbi:unnamed protein product [Closterium sp. Yama58-4]|nr:unnamed protein product [Closterium sp. Yama58-4]
MARRWSSTAVKLTLIITAIALLLWRSPLQPLVIHSERLLEPPPSHSSAPFPLSAASSSSSFSASSFSGSEFPALASTSDATTVGPNRRLLSSSPVEIEIHATETPHAVRQSVRQSARLDVRQSERLDVRHSEPLTQSHIPEAKLVISTAASVLPASPHNTSTFFAASPPLKRKISPLLPHDPAPGNCSAPIHGSPAEQCAAARAEAACRSGAQLEYLQFFYCTFEGSPIGVALLLTWLAALIFLLGNVAADFFCPSLEELAELLRLPPAVAGVTLLPLGNGAPDVFASVVAFVGKGHQSLVGFNGVLGAACFVSTVVAGSVCLVAASKAPRVQLHRSSFIRDLTFFLLAVLALCVLVWQRAVHLPHALLFFSIYPAYCLAVALYHCLPTREPRTPRFQIHPFLRSVSQATIPHWLWTHERSLFHSRLHTHHYLHPSNYLPLPFIFSRENSANSDAPPGHVEAEDVTAGSCSVVLPPCLLSPPLSSSPSRTPPPVLHSTASADFAGAADADTAAAGLAGVVAGATRGGGNRMAASVTDDLREPLWGYDEEMEDPELVSVAPYDVASLLAHRKTESGEEQVLVRFFGFADEEDEWVSARLSVRPRSLPCEGSECVAVLPGDVVLCFQEASDQALYFDADVRDVQRRRHDVRGCRCRFWVRYRHDNTEEVVPLRKICRRPETEYRVKAAQQVDRAVGEQRGAEGKKASVKQSKGN